MLTGMISYELVSKYIWQFIWKTKYVMHDGLGKHTHDICNKMIYNVNTFTKQY